MPPGIDYSFDATQFTPRQAGDAHPLGKFPATISNTSIVPTKTNDGGMFVVEFTTPSGSITSRYNLWNNNSKAVEIAHNELSALCHATGVFKLDFKNEGAALRNARCMIEVADQLDKDRKPNGYVEVKKVYDQAGNEPGKPPTNPAPQTAAPQQSAPMTQGANGGWGNQPASVQPPQQAPNPAPTGWNTSAQPQQPNQSQPGTTAAPASPPPWAQPR